MDEMPEDTGRSKGKTFEFVCSGGSSFVCKFVDGLKEVKGLKFQINYHYVLHLNVAS